MRDLIIGIDGGGTKTNLIALDVHSGQTLAAAGTGSIHLSAMGEPAALEHFRLGIAGLGLGPGDRIAGIAMGDPSRDDCDDDTPDSPLSAAAAAILGSEIPVYIKSDVFMAMYAFTGGEPGAFLVSGTGSMGMAIAQPYRHGGSNTYLTVGGWGMPASDPGSGYDIALQGIQAAFHAFDGVAAPTLLCGALLEFGNAADPRDLIPWFNSGTLTRGQIARFAQWVDACAGQGDRAAIAILESAGHALARYAIRLLQQLPQPRIGIYGSVLLNNRRVFQTFETHVLSLIPEAQIRRPPRAPEYGAAMFAADALHIDRSLWTWK